MEILDKEPVFRAPWHAQIFALTVHLNETGLFSWPDWAERFSSVLAAHGLDRDLDGGEDYFNAWLEALEAMLTERDVAGAKELHDLKHAWEAAYLRTPHGQPVHL